MQKLVRWYKGASIRVKMTALFVIMSIIPACVLGAVSLQMFSRNFEQNGIQDSQLHLEFLDYRLDEEMRGIHKAVLLTAHDDSIRGYFDAGIVLTQEERFEMERMAKRSLIGLRLSQGAQSVMLVGQNGGALVYSLKDFTTVRYVEDPDYQILTSAAFRIYDSWAEPTTVEGAAVVPYERIVLGASAQTPVARLVVHYPESFFAGLYQGYEKEKYTNFFVLNGDGRILSCMDKALFARDAREALGVSPEALADESGSFHAGNYLITYRVNARRGYTLLERIPLSVFSSMFRPIVLLLLGIAGICLIACLLLGAFLSRSLTKPLYALIDRVSTDKTSAAHASALGSRNEIAILSKGYDDVIDRLESLIAEYYEEQRKKKEAQIRALEFQINPHFLYNTLSTIIWLIDAGEGERAIEITQKLSSFFRISISKGREFITLREEVRHVRLYIDIQKARYADRIFVAFEVPEALMEHETPKLILQPLVENSIIHAMQTNRDKICHIIIRARLEGGAVVLEVEDDGETATGETIAAMNAFLRDRALKPADKNYGIGISNVHDRIRMSFGEDYGLNYLRVGGKTVATLRIRAMEGGSGRVSNADR